MTQSYCGTTPLGASEHRTAQWRPPRKYSESILESASCQWLQMHTIVSITLVDNDQRASFKTTQTQYMEPQTETLGFFLLNVECLQKFLLYRLGPSSRQKVTVSMASSSKNSVVNASHHRLSQSWWSGNKCFTNLKP